MIEERGVGTAPDFKKPNAFQSFLGDLTVPGNASAFLLILIELSLLWAVLYQFEIEGELGFPQLLSFIFLGFLVHHFLPPKYRLPFFFLLFVVTVASLVGIQESLIVTSVGLGLLVIAHLPLPYWVRVSAICLVASVLAVLRLNWINSSWGHKVIPIVASMFMFRFILYLFELKKGMAMGGWWQRITYFFLLPNICFTLFPVIDYRTFLSSYYNQSRYEIYQKGVRWMTWGTLQLLLYRIIYYYWVPTPADVIDLSTLLLYCFASYMLILKLAGQAYLILGILCLFGWNLPTNFHLYFLASGFSDLWRRVTIYWKNFMMKVFYYPVYFAMRRYGLPVASMASLIVAFLLTWTLHSYQYFWIQGSFLLRSVDGIFWGVFGISVAVDSFFQLRKKQRKSLAQPAWKLRKALKNSSKIVFFFVFMCLFFSFWACESVSEWLAIVSVVRDVPPWQWAMFLGGILVTAIIGTIAQIPLPRSKLDRIRFISVSTASIYIVVSLSLLIGLRFYRFDTKKKSFAGRFISSIRMPGWNKRDAELAERGYYEPLLNTNMLASELFSGRKLKPVEWGGPESGASRSTNDLLSTELIPSIHTTFKNVPFSTNSYGMRDQQYSRRKPADTYRFALLGGSFEMGWGIADGETFEAVAEKHLNQMGTNHAFSHYEILNFSVNGYDLVRNVKLCDTKVFGFEPDAVICSLHTGNTDRTTRWLAKLMKKEVDLEYDILRRVQVDSGFHRGMNLAEVQRILRPYMDEVTKWSLERIAKIARENHSIPICLILPTIQMTPEKDEVSRLIQLANEFGYVTINLSDIFDNYNPQLLMVAPWDSHPNARAHGIIADSLYREILKRPQSLKMVPSGPRGIAFNSSGKTQYRSEP